MPANKDLLARAHRGDVWAQCQIAHVFMKAEDVRGYRRALPWLRRAAACGERWAEYHLGLIYDHGLAGRRDRRRAAQWYERAVARKYASAQLNLGIIVANRRGRHRDLRRAVHLYRLAANQGRAKAAYNLGLYYSEGRGVRRSVAQAKRWYRQAADLGDRDARRILKVLGRACNSSVNPTARPVTARAFARSAASPGPRVTLIVRPRGSELQSMSGGGQHFVVQARLTVTAGYFGILPEPELLVWLRAAPPRPGKVLVVQPVEPIDSADHRTRTFHAAEFSIAPERVSAVIGMFNTLGFPSRQLEIEDTGDPESIWWAGAMLEVTIDDVSGRLGFGFGPDGIRGRDAAGVQEVLRAMLECARVRSGWSDVLLGGGEART